MKKTYIELACLSIYIFLCIGNAVAKDKLDILIIGDSISIGYAPHLADLMEDKANVYHHPGNAGATRGLPDEVEEWMKLKYDGVVKKWDVVVFNYGIWDMARKEMDGPARTDLKTFEKRIRQAGERIRQTEPDAKIIWANITAIPEGGAPHTREEDPAIYNDTARKAIEALGIPECDLYSLTKDFDETCMRPNNVHFHDEGYKKIAEKVRDKIEEVLRGGDGQGMVLIHGGTNKGVDPDFGEYSLAVDSFYMDRCEVTKALWDDVRDWSKNNGYAFDNAGLGKADNHPVHSVSWYDCAKWCNARSEKEGLKPVYYTDKDLSGIYRKGQTAPFVDASADGYRLPTSEEWRYAARGGVVGKRFPWSDADTIMHSRANYRKKDNRDEYDKSETMDYHPKYDDGIRPHTNPVGDIEAGRNGYGLYDMAGNVWEWCFDWVNEGTHRAIRSGCWRNGAGCCRVGCQDGRNFPHAAADVIGFRTVRSVKH